MSGGPAYDATLLGKGYLIDNVKLSSGPLTSPTPRGIKQAVLAEMQSQAQQPMDGDTAKKLNEGIKHLMKSVNSPAWLDDSHLATKDADPVFNEEKATVDQIEDIKPASGITATVQAWMQRLATADRQLATTACTDGAVFPALAAATPEVQRRAREGRCRVHEGRRPLRHGDRSLQERLEGDQALASQRDLHDTHDKLGRLRAAQLRSRARCRRWESNPHSPKGTGF